MNSVIILKTGFFRIKYAGYMELMKELRHLMHNSSLLNLTLILPDESN
jgi:hypothetical protein